MKTKTLIFIVVISFLFTGFLNAQSRSIEWNTFMGGAGDDRCYGMDRGVTGNIYVTGYGSVSWGTPVNAHSGSNDVLVAALDSSGNLLWNTFLGSSDHDFGYGITVDGSNNIYVTGYSLSSWGSPVNAFSGVWDVFVAKLDSSGNLLWNTFMGSADSEYGQGIALDSSGNIYVTGYSLSTWGSPVNVFSGGGDAFIACLNSSGTLLWNTFLGSSGDDRGHDIVLDGSGNIYVTGYSESTWGTPVNTHSGGDDVLVTKLNSSGSLQWHTFLGSSSKDKGDGIALDGSGNIYITGVSEGTWGSPLNAHSGGQDAVIVKLDGSGNRQWHTFLGSSTQDQGYDIALDDSGNVHVTGHSNASWGTPGNPHSGGWDAFVAILTGSGSLLANTFLGSSEEDYGHGIVADGSGHLFVAGYGYGTWGSPVNAHSGSGDIFAARFFLNPLTDIVANGCGSEITITESDSLQIRVSLNRFGSGENVDYWLAYKGPAGWVHYNNSTKKWETGLGVTHQGALMDLNNKKVFQKSGLAPGNYTFYFGVDMNMNGKVTKSSLFKDEVQVTVTSN